MQIIYGLLGIKLYLFVQQTSSDYLPRVRHCARYWRYNGEEGVYNPGTFSWQSLEEDIEK